MTSLLILNLSAIVKSLFPSFPPNIAHFDLLQRIPLFGEHFIFKGLFSLLIRLNINAFGSDLSINSNFGSVFDHDCSVYPPNIF
jgi:hypothetical protein